MDRKMTRKLYTVTKETLAQLAQLSVWVQKSQSEIVRIAVSEMYEKVKGNQP